MMRRFALLAAAIIGLAGQIAAAADYKLSDTPQGRLFTHASGYSVTLPSDWYTVPDRQGIDLIASNNDGELVCHFRHVSRPDLVLSDADARAAMTGQHLGQAFFTKIFLGGLKDIRFVSERLETLHPSGWPFQSAAADFTLPDGSQNRALMMLTIRNKMIYAATCFSERSSYGRFADAARTRLNAIRLTN